jgi:SDR family mycofactocin-dependent oxidoreductase
MGRLTGKVLLITGGASGQGRSHALMAAREGAAVVVTDICEVIPEVLPYETSSAEELAETVSMVEELDAPVLGIKADARSSSDMQAAVDEVISTFGQIDALAVNHGVTANLPWDQQTDEVWDAIIETNLSALWRTTKAVIPHMIEQESGSIVFTSSCAATCAYPSLSAYTASKAGVIGLMRSLAAELAPHSIRVNAILPTNCETKMFLSPTVMDMFVGHENASVEETKFPSQASLLLPIPWIQPEDLSNALLFLISDEARYVTAVEMPVDAGTTIQPPGIPPLAARRLAELEEAAAAQAAS